VLATIDKLLKEHQACLLRERRAAERQAFCRPVKIICDRRDLPNHIAFSRDVSPHGIGLIDRIDWSPGTTAHLVIHGLFGNDYSVSAVARWCESFGKDWYLTGWTFLAER
jgi:hypothetical protein